MSKWRPLPITHWAVILNRSDIRKYILEIREARRQSFDSSILEKRLRYSWKRYRWCMGQQEIERRAYLSIDASTRMFNAVIGPMI